MTETETLEPAPTDEDLAREHIETAAEHVAAGVVKWDELAGANSDMLGVTAEANTVEFSVSAIGNTADGVDDELIAAEEYIVEGLHPIAPQIGFELVDDDIFLFDLTSE